MRHHKQYGRRRAHGARTPLDRSDFEAALRGSDGSASGRNPAWDHKALQLCRQVERALSLALAGECGDDALRELIVDGVEPMGSSAQLLVRVCVPTSVGLPVHEVLARLETQSSRLRHVVAQAICRKRTPMLTFVCLPPAWEGGRDA